MNPPITAGDQVPGPAPLPTDSAAGPRRTLPVEFHGRALDYFRVWIVNVLLTVVTLGVWSAWAKVRTRRWFYGHTRIDGHSFDYHATGRQILVGRIIALAVLVAASIISRLSPAGSLAVTIAILCLLSWTVNAGLRFSAAMMSWRNVRFGFQGNYMRAACVFLLMPAIAVLTLGLLTPLASRMAGRYVAGGYRYGNAAFASTPRLGALYGALVLSILVFFVIMILGLLLAAAVAAADGIDVSMETLALDWYAFLYAPEGRPPAYDSGLLKLLIAALGPSFYAAFFIAGLYYGACLRNELFKRLTLTGGHRMQSRLSPLVLIWIVISGLVATVVTLGLAYPWARVRHYRYLTQSLTVLAAPGLDELVSQQQNAPGSFGSEFSELEGFGSAAMF